MKKIGTFLFIVLVSTLVFVFGFTPNITKQPNTYYQVYLDDELIGMIESKKDLEDYINNQANIIRENIRNYKLIIDSINTFDKYKSNIKNKDFTIDQKVDYLMENKATFDLTNMDIDNLTYFKEHQLYLLTESEINEINEYIDKNIIYEYADEIFTPNGIEIKKIYTFNNNIKSVEEIYKDIISKKDCTIAGYKFIIKNETEGLSDLEIYTLDKKVFSDAIDDMIKIFVDDAKYELYKKNNQLEIQTTGSIIENVYVNQDITYKAVNIPVQEKIYTSSKDLSKFLLYDTNYKEQTIKVKSGDSIESLAFNNKISVQEFLISNPQYTSRDNLLVIGANVKISKLNPKIEIVEETYEIVDKPTDYNIIEQYDDTLNQGSVIIAQAGEKGLERVSQNVKTINGEITYVDPIEKETIKNSIPKVIRIGTKYIPNVGSLSSWGWPTNSGYTLSSYYGYRLSIFGEGNFHSGIDIAGTGYGSPVYAANNGTIEEFKNLGNTSYGKYIVINHNNGYYTLYGHLSGFASNLTVGMTVSRGDVIGYVGSSGWATGPHLHYEIRTCRAYSCTTNPLRYY